MKRIHAVLLVIGASWFAFALWVVASNVILRETRLGVVAQLLDRLPPVVGNPIFILFWAILLLGWTGLIGFGLRPLVRRQVMRRDRHND
jgi:hypothetical protein